MSVVLAVLAFFANTLFWTGANNGVWTDAGNWKDVNGGSVAKCPGALKSADMAECWHNWTNDNDTAVFVGAGGGHTTIDTSGLFSIANIVIRGAATPVYTFGDGLPIRSRGSFTVESDVVNMPVLGTIALGVGYEDIAGNQRQHMGNVDFYNSAAQPLTIGDYIPTVINPDTIKTTSSIFYWTVPRYHPRGSGGFRLTGSCPQLGSTYRLYAKFAAGPGKTTVAVADYKPYSIFFIKDVANEPARVEIEDGCVMGSYGKSSDSNIGYEENRTDAVITGAGTYAPQSGSYWNLLKTTLTIASRFDTPGGDFKIAASYDSPYIVLADEVVGLMTGDTSLERNDTQLTVPSIGAPGVPSSLGTGSAIKFVNETVASSLKPQVLNYAGAGETSTRALTFSRAAAGALPVVLRQKGTGEWILGGAFDNACANGLALTLDNATASPAEIAGAIADGASSVSLAKSGSGVWRLGGACTYTGATTVSGGSLVVTNAGSLASSDVTLAAEATLAFAASATAVSKSLKSIAVTGSGTAILAVGAGVTLDLTTLPTAAATAVLDIRTETGARVTAMNFKGTKLSYGVVRLNGQRAAVGADGVIASGVYPVDERVNVLGGVITSDADKTYGFQKGGTSGTVTLDGTAVEVDAIAQDLAGTAATVTIGDGQTLTADALAIAAGGANLTIAPKTTTGAIAVAARGLLLDNQSKTATMTVSAPLQFASGAVISKLGVGSAILDATGGWTGDFSLSEGSLTFADPAEATRTVTLVPEANPPAEFSYAANGATAALVKKAGSESALKLTGTAPATDTQTLEVRSGTVHVTGSATSLRYYSINAATTVADETANLVIDGGAKVSTGYEVFVGPKTDLAGARGTLTVSNATFTLDSAETPLWMHNAVFLTAKGAGAVMRIGEGAVVSNNLIIGGYLFTYGQEGNGAPCACYQSGGDVCLYGHGNTAYASAVGMAGYGYYEATGGKLNFKSAITVGNSRTSSGQWGQGVLYIGPKVSATTGELRLSYGYGDTHVIRSLVRVQGQLTQATDTFPQFNGAYNATERAYGQADFVLDGDDAYYTNGGSTYSARTYLNGIGRGGSITLYAGTYQHYAFWRGDSPNDTAPYYLNLNGGCLRATNSGGTGADYSNAFGLDNLDRVTVFARGVIVDSNAPDRQANTYHATLDAPLREAPGSGIASVPLPESVADGTFVGPPFVEFEGDGTGAVAVVEFDSDAGKVTGVKVVSPGWNYMWANAHFITGTETNGTSVLTSDDFAENARGPLAKRGPGVLHLTAANEISTFVSEQGTTLVETEGAIPASAGLDLRGGLVDMGTQPLVFGSLSGTGGTLKGVADAQNRLAVTTENPGTGLSTGVTFRNASDQEAVLQQTCAGDWTVAVEDILAGTVVSVAGALTFGSGATLTVSGDTALLDPKTNYTLLKAEAGTFTGSPTLTNLRGWRTRRVGDALRLEMVDGLIFIVR